MKNQDENLTEQLPLTFEEIQEKVVLMEQFAVGILEAFHGLNEQVVAQREAINKLLQHSSDLINNSSGIHEVVESMGHALVAIEERIDNQEEVMSNMIDEYGKFVESVGQALNLTVEK